MKEDGIILSEEHGLNASIETCMLCDEDIGIIVFGKLPDDKKAPSTVCMGHICDDCEKRLAEEHKVVIAEADPYPTGRYIEIPDEYLAIEAPEARIAYINTAEFSKLIRE